MLLSLISEVSLNYIELRTLQERLTIANANIAIQNDTYQLSLWRHEAGLVDALSVEQSLYNLESSRAMIPNLRYSISETINRIALLLGEHPGRLNEELEKTDEIPCPSLSIAIGIPADVIRRRPDIRRAERELARETAKIGVAMAEAYPKLSLTGSIGIETLALSGSSVTTKLITGGGFVTFPVFRAGAIRQNIEVQSAIQEQALIKYESVILNAIKEIEDALKSLLEENERKEILSSAVESAKSASDLALNKYRSGLSDFNSVLDSQRSLLALQDQLAQSKGLIAKNLIKLYKALGGGWESLSLAEKN
ncbi:MAG: efflux transporter outer membrane subunit [Thermodesulfovibrionales bacterium]|nr:efflux transporter outer membrane subunit [Thermodesulfovibrionales bacterium]